MFKNGNELPETINFREAQELYGTLARDLEGFTQLALILKRLAGIHLPTNDKNLSLMASRIAPLLRQHNLSSYTEFARIVGSGDSALTRSFVEAMTTNTTSFFREEGHFPVLRKALLDLKNDPKNAGRNELRIWCAAASTGQEPYSLAMTVHEVFGPVMSIAVRILATDVDHDALHKASRGVYTSEEIGRVEENYRRKYFDRRETSVGTRYVAKPFLKEMITFAPLNLVDPTWPFRNKFDVVICRNVLIYFERDTVARVVANMTKALAPGGFLFLGHAETSAERPDSLKPVSHAVWQKTSKAS